MPETVTILFTSVGRRVRLMDGFRRAMAALGVAGRVLAADRSALAPGFHRADAGFLVPGVAEGGYVDALVEICRREKVDLVVPLIDWELHVVARERARFEEAGVRLLVSSERVTEICRDKQETFAFLSEHGIGVPRLLTYEEACAGPFPVIVKARFGSSAKGVHRVMRCQDLPRFRNGGDGVIFQEYVEGPEYTVDVWAGLDGVPRVAVPRQRLQVRAGEVSKGRTVRDEAVIAESMRLVRALAECIGVITCQCRATPDGRVVFFDLNPRFGGGVPLAIEAGADFPRWVLQEHLGRSADADPDAWEAGLLMLRYDAEVFVRESDLPPGSWTGDDLAEG